MSNLNIIRDDPLKYYAMVTKLVHYTSKFALNEDGRQSKQHPSTKNRRFSLNFDLTDKFVFSQISITRILILKKSHLFNEPVFLNYFRLIDFAFYYLDQMKVEDFV